VVGTSWVQLYSFTAITHLFHSSYPSVSHFYLELINKVYIKKNGQFIGYKIRFQKNSNKFKRI
jgi:hypothetical protein